MRGSNIHDDYQKDTTSNDSSEEEAKRPNGMLHIFGLLFIAFGVKHDSLNYILERENSQNPQFKHWIDLKDSPFTYIWMFLVGSLFVIALVRRLGYRALLLIGGLAVLVCQAIVIFKLIQQKYLYYVWNSSIALGTSLAYVLPYYSAWRFFDYKKKHYVACFVCLLLVLFCEILIPKGWELFLDSSNTTE